MGAPRKPAAALCAVIWSLQSHAARPRPCPELTASSASLGRGSALCRQTHRTGALPGHGLPSQGISEGVNTHRATQLGWGEPGPHPHPRQLCESPGSGQAEALGGSAQMSLWQGPCLSPVSKQLRSCHLPPSSCSWWLSPSCLQHSVRLREGDVCTAVVPAQTPWPGTPWALCLLNEPIKEQTEPPCLCSARLGEPLRVTGVGSGGRGPGPGQGR